MRVIGYIESSFWSMREQEFASMMRVAYAHEGELDALLAHEELIKPDTLMTRSGERLSGTRYVEMRGNVAVIDVNGAIAKRMDFFTEVCNGGTSTEKLMKDFGTALNSPSVDAIVFNIDSPGGEAFGINELAQAIYDARGQKPIKAYVSGLGASGAYWIASAADEIITDKSAFLGSIGVVTSWMDDKGFYEKLGIRKEVITSTNAPNKRLNFDNPEHRAELQKELDAIESVFIGAVAQNLGISVDAVKADFNQGGVLIGTDAVQAGMAHRTGSLEDVIASLQSKTQTAARATASAEGDIDMSFRDTFKAWLSGEESPTVDADPILTEEVIEEAVAEEPEQPVAESAAMRALQDRLFDTEAASFIDAEIRSGRMVPAEKAAIKAAYIQAASDDVLHPLTSGSRIESLKAAHAARKPHGLTDEVIDVEANQVLLASTGDVTDEQKRADLLSKTHLGKAAMKLIDGGKTATAR